MRYALIGRIGSYQLSIRVNRSIQTNLARPFTHHATLFNHGKFPTPELHMKDMALTSTTIAPTHPPKHRPGPPPPRRAQERRDAQRPPRLLRHMDEPHAARSHPDFAGACSWPFSSPLLS